MDNWREYKISDLCEVGRGSSPRPIIDQRFFEGGTIPWVKIADATASGKYIFKTKEHVNEYGASFSRYLDKGSLIIAASGVSLGQIKFLGFKGCIHDGWLYTSNFKEELIEKEFLYYFLIYYSEGFHNYSYGAAIQNINTDILKKTVIRLPSLLVQQKIVSILNNYDELIEVNNQRIKVLEETARQLYKEWFVRMRFPGYKKAKFEKGIPEGWEVKKLGAISKLINRGISPKYDDGGESIVLNQRCIRNNRIDLEVARRQSKDISISKFLKRGDVLINSTGEGTLGRTAQLNEELPNLTADSHLTIARPNDGFSKEFYGMTVCSLEDYFEQMALGSTGQTELSRTAISNVLIRIPNKELLNKFSSCVFPINAQVVLLLQQNTQLRQIRDRLLPRLISGKLKVKAATEELICP